MECCECKCVDESEAIATVIEGWVLVDARRDGRLIYVASGEEESCANDTGV